MSLSNLPLELIDEIVHWLRPKTSNSIFMYMQVILGAFSKEERARYAEYHDVYWADAWEAILDGKMDYVDEISAGERWEQPSYVPSWDEFSQLDFPPRLG